MWFASILRGFWQCLMFPRGATGNIYCCRKAFFESLSATEVTAGLRDSKGAGRQCRRGLGQKCQVFSKLIFRSIYLFDPRKRAFDLLLKTQEMKSSLLNPEFPVKLFLIAEEKLYQSQCQNGKAGRQA